MREINRDEIWKKIYTAVYDGGAIPGNKAAQISDELRKIVSNIVEKEQ